MDAVSYAAAVFQGSAPSGTPSASPSRKLAATPMSGLFSPNGLSELQPPRSSERVTIAALHAMARRTSPSPPPPLLVPRPRRFTALPVPVPHADFLHPRRIISIGRRGKGKGPARECGICFDPITLRPDPARTTPRPQHKLSPHAESTLHGVNLACNHNYCHRCLDTYLRTQLYSNRIPFTCPGPSCSTPIPSTVIAEALSSDDLTLYVIRLDETHMKDVFYCPNRQCNRPLDAADVAVDDYEVSCPYCARGICTRCRSSAHPHSFCLPTPADEADRGVLRVAERLGWRRCGRCGFIVERIDGCNHMECRCGHEFCHVCGRPWDPYASACAYQTCALSPSSMSPHSFSSLSSSQSSSPTSAYPIPPRADSRQDIQPAHLVRMLDRSRDMGTASARWRFNALRHRACGYCTAIFPTLDLLARHLREDPAHPIYICCNLLYPHQRALTVHRQFCSQTLAQRAQPHV